MHFQNKTTMIYTSIRNSFYTTKSTKLNKEKNNNKKFYSKKVKSRIFSLSKEIHILYILGIKLKIYQHVILYKLRN